eukprot:m.192873 g.192873  ORF g.192873 m.192873 type:complete len:116 (-) comp16775_c2_seq2:608-955(-)
MTCRPGFIHKPLFSDNTGECIPSQPKVQNFKLTCPATTPGCQADNTCLECHISCVTCMSQDPKIRTCGSTDCFTCPPGSVLHTNANSVTGSCISVVEEPDRFVMVAFYFFPLANM